MLPVASPEELALVQTTAARYRSERAQYKRRIASGEVTVDDVRAAIEAGDRMVGHIRLDAFLRSFPYVGNQRALRICAHFGLEPNRRLIGLGFRQRHDLFCYLTKRERARTRRASRRAVPVLPMCA